MARVLVAAKDGDLRELLRFLLAQDGHDASVAASGAEALSMCRTDGFDLVCLDLDLPRVNGIEVTRGLRARADDVPVLMITGFALPEELAAARAAGVTDLLSMPFHPSGFRAHVDGLLG